MASTLFVLHHFGLGDHLVCSGLVRFLAQAHAKVFVFCKSEYAETVNALFSDTAGKVEAYCLDNNNNSLCASAKNIPHLKETCIGIAKNANGKFKCIGFRPIEGHHGASFDDSFYIQSGIPFDHKWSRFLVPQKFYKPSLSDLKPSKRYAFVHQDISRGFLIDTAKISLPIVQPSITSKEKNLLSWISVLQEASEIHCIDSCFLNLVDLLNESKVPMLHNGNIFYHWYSRQAVIGAQPHLRKKWIRFDQPPKEKIVAPFSSAASALLSLSAPFVKRQGKLINYHVADGNLGDAVSSPLLYFQFPKFDSYHMDLRRFSHQQASGEAGMIIVGGGGLIYQCHEQMERLGSLDKSLSKKILWGVGHNSHFKKNEEPSVWPSWIETGYHLAGVRDHGSPFFYLPDVSCMSHLLDTAKRPAQQNKFGIYYHQENPICEEHEIMNGMPMLSNFHPSFENVINFLLSCETIVTNTYHGAYWSLLLRKKVLLYRPFSTRFSRLKHAIPSIQNIHEITTSNVLEQCPLVSNDDYLTECREINFKFFQDVNELM